MTKNNDQPARIQITSNSPQEDVDAVFEELRELKRSIRGSQHDKAIVCLAAMIAHGINTRPRMVGAANQLGFNYRHIVQILEDCAGPVGSDATWQRDFEGVFSLHPNR